MNMFETCPIVVAARVGTDNGHLRIAWPVLRAVNGLTRYFEHVECLYKAQSARFRCFGKQSITLLAAYEPDACVRFALSPAGMEPALRASCNQTANNMASGRATVIKGNYLDFDF
eukprot:5933031-Pleurochrysis_carterae.AAC.4